MPYTEQEVRQWYGNHMQWDQVSSSDGAFLEDQSLDWLRLKIYDPDQKKLVNAMPLGHAGTPELKDMERLYDAFQKGNLLLYPLGKTQPRRAAWSEKQDKMVWNDIEVEKYRDLPPVGDDVQLPQMPKRSDFVQELSGFKKLMNRWFNLFRQDVQAYNDSVAAYENAVNNYNTQKTLFAAKTEREMAAAILQEEPANEISLQEEQKEASYRADPTVREIRWTTWRLDHTLDTLDALFGPRPQRCYPQITTGLPTAGNTLSEKGFQELETHGYDLPADSKLSYREAATVNLMLFCAPSVTEPAFRKVMVGDAAPRYSARDDVNKTITGIFFKPRYGQNWLGIHTAFDAAKKAIDAYQKGDPKPLGQYLGDGLRNFNRMNNTYRKHMSPDKCGFGLLAEQMLELLNNHPDLMEAAQLPQEELEYAQSHIQVSRIATNGFKARMTLEKANAGMIQLDASQKAKCMADIGLHNMMFGCFGDDMTAWERSEEYARLTGELTNKMAADQAKLTKAREKWDHLDNKERAQRDKQWMKTHGNPADHLNTLDTYRPLSQFQAKLGQPGVADTLIQSYRALPGLEDNVKDLTPKQLLEVADKPQKLGELMQKSQDDQKFSLEPAVKQAQKEHGKNNGSMESLIPGFGG